MMIVNLLEHLEILHEALKVAREGLKVLEDQSPVAMKTLEEINKICQKIGKE